MSGKEPRTKRFKSELEPVIDDNFIKTAISLVDLDNDTALEALLTQLKGNDEKQKLINRLFYHSVRQQQRLNVAFLLFKLGGDPGSDIDGNTYTPGKKLVFTQYLDYLFSQGQPHELTRQKVKFLKLMLGKVKNIDHIVKFTKDDNSITTNLTETVLSAAIEIRDPVIVQLLFNKGANPNTILIQNYVSMPTLEIVFNELKKEFLGQSLPKLTKHQMNIYEIVVAFIEHPNINLNLITTTGKTLREYIETLQCANQYVCSWIKQRLHKKLEKETRPGLVQAFSKITAIPPQFEKIPEERRDPTTDLPLPLEDKDYYKWNTSLNIVPKQQQVQLPPDIWSLIILRRRQQALCKDLDNQLNLAKIQVLATLLNIRLDQLDTEGKAIRPYTKRELCQRISRTLSLGKIRWTPSDEKQFQKFVATTKDDYQQQINNLKRIANSLGIDPSSPNFLEQLSKSF